MSFHDNITENESYKQDYIRPVLGITFVLPSRHRFIPYSWLLYCELNQSGTELQLHYTHTVVTITGKKLRELHGAVEEFKLQAVQELPHAVSFGKFPEATVSRIEIAEKLDA